MILRISKSNLTRGIILIIFLVSVLLLRIVVIPVGKAGSLVVDLGYYFLAAIFFLFLYSTAKVIPAKQLGRLLTRHLPGLLVCLLLTGMIHLMEPHRFKVLNDEFALLNNSMAMHHYQKAGLMGQADLVEGELMHPSFSADKRSLSFQFLLSLVHTLSGYRPGNAFFLNAFLTAGFLVAVYAFLNQVQPDRLLSIAGIVLVSCIPLYSQVATSGAYDLLNVTLLLLFLITGTAYVRSPGLSQQALFVLTGLLLAQSRYESLLYLVCIGLVTAFVWHRDKEVRLSWISVLSPVFLFIPLMANAHMFAHDVLQDASVRESNQAFMSMGHMFGNLADAIAYFFNPSIAATNSVVLSILGLVGFVYLLFAILVSRKSFLKGMRPAVGVYLAVLPVTITCFLLMTSNFWGRLTDPMASRFAMPMYLMGLVAGIITVNRVCRREALTRWILAGAGILFLSVSLPRIFDVVQTEPMIRSEYHHWILDFVGSGEHGRTLYSCDGTLGLVAFNEAAIPIEALNISPDAIAGVMESGLYDSIYAFDLSVLDPATGEWTDPPGSTGLDFEIYATAVEDEVWFGEGVRARAYRLTGIYAR